MMLSPSEVKMKVQYVSIRPTEKAEELGLYAFTPELLASVGARYSRNNEGLDAIASKIDFNNTDKSVDSIFKMLDYGHASIADMTPIALFIDDIHFLLHIIFGLFLLLLVVKNVPLDTSKWMSQV